MEISVSSLPREVLIRIFEYLDIRHRLIVGQVCKEWLDATNCRLLLKDVSLFISPKNEEAVKALPCMMRQFKCFTFYQVAIDSYFLQFLKHFSEQLISLTFIDCQLDKYYFYTNPEEKIPSCDNLRFLKIRGCGAFALFGSLRNVTTLEILYCLDLTDRDIHELDKSMPNLVTFTFANRVACDPRAYKRFYIKGNSVENEPSDAILSFPAIRNFIAKRSKTLVSMDFSRTGLSPTAAIEISTTNNLRLHTMLFSYDLSGSRIETFCRNQPTLTSLDLSTALNLTDEILSNICRILINLRELVVVFKHKIDVSVIDIFKLKHLQKLNLNFCTNISPFSFQAAISDLKSVTANLKYLNLAFTKISDVTLRKLLSHNRDIEHLDLTFTDISNTTLHFISKSLPRLKCLIINSCKRIYNSGLTGEHDCNSAISDCSSPETCVPLSNLRELRTLDLSKNPLITSDACVQSIRFKYLEVLKLYGCQCLDSAVGLQILLQNPSLKEFQLAYDLDD
ncbi:uncharacterized protein LOC129957130 [Argiope bruennichi]|uniref:F-box/LRR-repeat protein 20 like protein n=1 Tax=Argiope bruennichi TaxID=94029 RepID=A0A8T0FDQ7_ARGBR|nr:uncharacterized protein LOC129957130 [Argiope bruennichi]KAF8788452.1 F-box/LRR-repeat protein 20 like protein [Argiope bruennichi]